MFCPLIRRPEIPTCIWNEGSRDLIGSSWTEWINGVVVVVVVVVVAAVGEQAIDLCDMM